MTIIKCPECKKQISDKAATCPKCGYELERKEEVKTSKLKFDKKYGLLFIVIILFLILYFAKDLFVKYDTYIDNYYKISFEYPTDKKIVMDDDGVLYISKEVTNGGGVIPYTALIRYDSYPSVETFITDLTAFIKREYGTNFIEASQTSTMELDDRTITLITYSYKVEDYVIEDNRYAIVIDGSIYLVFTKEVNGKNSDNVSKTALRVLKSIKGVK